MDNQGFPNMTSYSHKDDGSPNSDSQPQVDLQHPQMQLSTSSYEYSYQILPRYPESSQRSVQGHSLTPYTFTQSTSYGGDLTDDIHAMNEHHTTQRYPLVSEPNAYSDLHTSLSINIESPLVDHHIQQTANTRLVGGGESTPPLQDYRQPLRGYHHMESHSDPSHQGRGHLIQRQPLSHERGHLQSGSGFYAPTQSIAAPDVATGHARRGTEPLQPLQQHSHPQMQQLQQPQLAAPLTYDMSTVNNISESNRTISARSAVAGSYGLSSHASSSIPMSNNPPPPLPAPRRSHHNIPHHEIGNIRQQQQGHLQNRHQNRNTSDASPSAYHPAVLQGRRASDLELSSVTVPLHNSISAPNLGLHIHHKQHPNSNPRTRSPDPSTIVIGGARLLRPALTTKPLLRQLSKSPHPHSDADSIGGSGGSVKYEDAEGDILNTDGSLRLKHISSMSALGDGGGKGRGGMGKRGGERRDDGPTGGKSPESGAAQGPGGGEEATQGPPKKKKKSKMHECSVCGKKFPRPSGLKTHMNTHNNEKPYPCGFPGCTRTFGVRSNAKRHLRTHGVIPAPASPSEPAYVVGFSPPVIMPAHSQDLSMPNSMGGDGIGLHDSQGLGVDGASLENSMAGFGGAGETTGPSHPRHLGRGSQFKLRWMPPSLMSRTNASSLREVHDEQDLEEEEEEGGSDDVEEEEADEEAEFGDVVSTERFSLPLRPVLPFSSAGVSPGYGLRGSGSGSNLAASSKATSNCNCSPPCPSSSSGSTTCTSALPHTSTSPSPSATSFATPPSSTSISPRISASTYNYSKILRPAAHGDSGLDSLSMMDFEERNSYLDAGSHPYHPSQLPDNATAP